MTLKLKPAEGDKSAIEHEKQAEKPAAPAAEKEQLVTPVKPVRPAAKTQDILKAATAAVKVGDGGNIAPVDNSEDVEDIPLTPQEKIMKVLEKVFFYLHKHIKIVAAVVVVIAIVPVVISLYYQNVLSNAEEALAEEDYQTAISHLNTYLAHDPVHLEGVLMLAQSYIHQNSYQAADQVLRNYAAASGGDDVSNLQMLLALIKLVEEDYQAANGHVEKVLSENTNDVGGHFIKAMIFFYGEKNAYEARLALDSAKQAFGQLSGEESAAAKYDIDLIRRFLYSNKPSVIAEELPLPFSELTEQVGASANTVAEGAIFFNLPLSPDGFYNFYSVPTGRKSLIEEDLTVVENILLFQAAAALTEGENEAAEKYLDEISAQTGDKSPALYYLYLSALLAAKNNDYARAAQYYRRVRSHVINVDVNLMLAAALWSDNQGEPPTVEMIQLYKEALSLQSDNIIAIANLSHLQLYESNFSEARELLTRGIEISPNNFQIVYNLSYLDILENGNLEQVEQNLYSLREYLPNSIPLAQALSQALIAQKKYSQAITELNGMKARAPSPDVYLEVARLYRERNQPLLVLVELINAREVFPDDKEILYDLLLEYAKQREVKEYQQLVAEIPEDELSQDYRVLLAAAMMTDDRGAANGYFREALVNTEIERKRRDVLINWLRFSLAGEDVDNAEEVLNLASQLYTNELPLQVRVFDIWLQALQADDVQREHLKNEIASFNLRVLRPNERMDVALALIALQEYNKAIALLESLAGTGDARRLLEALAFSHAQAGDDKSAKAVQKRLQVVENRASRSISERQKNAGNESGEVGLVYSHSGDEKSFAVSKNGGAESSAGDEENISRQLEQALQVENYEQAITLYTQLLGTEGMIYTPAIVHQNRGVLYMKISDYENAVLDFEKALSLEELNEEDHISALYNYALALANSEKYEESAEVIEQLTTEQPNNLRFLALYTKILNKTNGFDKLIDVYNKMISLVPEQLNPYIELVKVYRILGKNDEALRTLNSALEVAPRSKAVHKELAELYAAAGDSKKAKEHIDIIKSL